MKVFDILKRYEKASGLDLRPVKEKISSEQNKPLTAAIFGQTGTGKSSLTNALFGTEFEIDDIRPCTKEPQAHEGEDENGNQVIFWDLPGIGESEVADEQYLKMYAQFATTCDVVLWAFQADTRSVGIDVAALEKIMSCLTSEGREIFLNKLAIVITKADSISADSWVFARDGVRGNRKAIVVTGKKTEEILRQKAAYFYNAFLEKYQSEIVNRTYISSSKAKNSNVPNGFWLDEDKKFIYHKGPLDGKSLERLAQKHLEFQEEIFRIRDLCKGVYCSSRLNYNLNEVKSLICHKAEGNSVLRLSQSVSASSGSIPWSRVLEIGIPIIYDKPSNTVLFSVDQL